MSNSVELKKILKTILNANLVPFIQGAPGVGKSAIVKKIANDAKLELIDLRLSQCDLTDLNGLPTFKDGRAVFQPFDLFPISGTEIPEGKKGWLLFLDEFNSANKSVQAAAYKLVLDRMVGNHPLHAKTWIVCAGNRQQDRAIVNNLSTAMSSRLIHLELEATLEEWLLEVGYKNDYDPRIIAYLKSFPNRLFTFDPAEMKDKTFACPRTWEFVNKLLKQFPEDIPPYFDEAIRGSIGEGVGSEFLTFTKVFNDIPSVDSIITNPTSAKIPSGSEGRYAITATLCSKVNAITFDSISKYIDRVYRETQDISFAYMFTKFILVNKMSLSAKFINSPLVEIYKQLDKELKEAQ